LEYFMDNSNITWRNSRIEIFPSIFKWPYFQEQCNYSFGHRLHTHSSNKIQKIMHQVITKLGPWRNNFCKVTYGEHHGLTCSLAQGYAAWFHT
jgi:hypothetical protein